MANDSGNKSGKDGYDLNVEYPKVLFIHSNPLVEGVPLLDYLEEESIIRKCCIDSKLAIRFSSEVGTVKALSSSLIHGANIIHYSGKMNQFSCMKTLHFSCMKTLHYSLTLTNHIYRPWRS